jgi:hypothetical protein
MRRTPRRSRESPPDVSVSINPLVALEPVVAFQKPIVATCEDIDLLQAPGLGAKRSTITSKILEVQYDPPRIFKVASKGTLGLR